MLLGSGAWLTYIALNHYAVLCKYLGRFKRADQIYQRTLRRLTVAQERSLHELATLYHNMGGLEHARNRPGRAEPLARKAVQIRRSLIGPNDPAVAEDEVALGAILDARYKHLAARRLYLRALKIFRAHPAGRRYDLAVTLNNLGASYHTTGDLERARPYYEEALKIKKRLFGSRHVDVALTMNNLALLCQARQDWERAEALLHGALAIFRGSLSARHPKLAACRKNYARLLAAHPFRAQLRPGESDSEKDAADQGDPAPGQPRFRSIVAPSKVNVPVNPGLGGLSINPSGWTITTLR